jgi:ABC-2 type transport system permease protein
MYAIKTFWGVFRYEFLMQIRRRSIWIAFACMTVLLVRIVPDVSFNSGTLASMPLLQVAATITLATSWLAPLGVGIFLADRLPRDRSMGVEELLSTLPGSLSSRMLGKYFGSLFAVMVPAFLMYCLVIGALVYFTRSVLVIPYALLCYSVIVLPGILFVAAFSLACTSVMWVPLYQFLFFGYWFWGNMFAGAGLPSLSKTILTPIGSFIGAGLFNASFFPWAQGVTPLQGVESLVVLLVVPMLVLIVLDRFLKWEQARA